MFFKLNPNFDVRDIAQCSPSAGIVPCHLLDFRRTLSAVEFYGKMERLYEQHLRNHCNNEWNVHFHALLLRLKGSLTCAGGLKPDHPIPGFKPQPVQPAIQGKVLRLLSLENNVFCRKSFLAGYKYPDLMN